MQERAPSSSLGAVATKKVIPAGVSDADLRLGLREAIARLGKPTSPAELRKALPKPHQRPPAELARLLADLAREGSLFAVKDGAAFRYCARDPGVVLASAVQAALAAGPLSKKALEQQVKRAAPGFEKFLPAALAVEIARGAVREHPKVGKDPLRYGREPPDPAPFLPKTVKEVQALARKLAPSGVTLAAIHAALGRSLGLTSAAPPDTAAEDAEVRAALHSLTSREPAGTLLSVRALRGLVTLAKEPFDRAVLRLSRAGELTLHHHDFPDSLPEAERALLVQDARGVYYVGVAPRGREGSRS